VKLAHRNPVEAAMTRIDDDALERARAQWQWRGQQRPPFAQVPLPGQVSVWDFPRPPRLVADAREVLVRWAGVEVARTRSAVCVQETSHPPSFYLPWRDAARELLQPASGGSFCEWKGPARYWSLVRSSGRGTQRLDNVAWSYSQPLAGAEALADCVAFYPADLECTVDGMPVRAQPGGFYGGWITPELTGPFKGAPGSAGW
jgi:uncharacterized protein (DUF427 family)